MRVTRDTLIRIARETVQQRTYRNPEIVAAYLGGSLRSESPFLGGITDIDLTFVHAQRPALRREIVPLPAGFHIDITHRSRDEYHPPRELRTNPWLAYEIYDPLLIYETQHFFEFTQASLRAGFHEPLTVLRRAYALMAPSRQMWLELSTTSKTGPKQVAKYLKAFEHAVNAVAELSGPPLAERRLLLDFPARAEAIERPDLSAAPLGLLGGTHLGAETLASWLPRWKDDFLAAAETGQADPAIHAGRLPYYANAFNAMMGSEHAPSTLWPLLRTWTASVQVFPAKETATWKEACSHLGLLGESFQERLQGLDYFLDQIEETLEHLATSQGIDPNEIFRPF